MYDRYVSTLYIVYFKEVNAMIVCDKKICENCKYFWADYSVNAFECENNEVNEEELDEYFSEGKEGCPHFAKVEEPECEDYIIESWEREILEVINEWCGEEYENEGYSDEEYLKFNREVGLAFTQCDDGTDVEVTCDVRELKVVYKVDHSPVHVDNFETANDLKDHLETLLGSSQSFEWMVQEYVDLETAEIIWEGR